MRVLGGLLFISLAAAANEGDCEALLHSRAEQIAVFRREVSALTHNTPALAKIYQQLRARVARSRILKDCAKAGGCSEAHIAAAVREAIAGSPLSNAAGYGFLIGGMVANAAASASVMVWVSPQSNFWPSFTGFFLGQAAFISASLLSPFSEPLAFRIRRAIFALKKDQNPVTNSELEATADNINGTYTAREQHAIDRIMLFRGVVRANMLAAGDAAYLGDRASVVSQLADAALAGYRYFRDINPAEPAIVNAVFASFLVRYPRPAELKADVLTLIQMRSPEPDSFAEQYYERALSAWLGSAR